MEQTAFVDSTDGKLAEVLVYRTSACGEGCGGNCMVCGTQKPIRVTAKNDAEAKKGDRVVIESNSGLVLALSFFTYIIPLVALLLGYLFASAAGVSDNGAALWAGAGLLVGFVPAVVINRGIKRKSYITYTVTKIF